MKILGVIDGRERGKKLFEEAFAMIPPDMDKFGDISFAVSDRIVELMNKRNMSKSDLAEAMGVRPSMVTFWIGGMHNFTLKTIAKLEVFFGEPILTIPLEFPPADVKNRSRKKRGERSGSNKKK